MLQDLSWSSRAGQYLDLYRELLGVVPPSGSE